MWHFKVLQWGVMWHFKVLQWGVMWHFKVLYNPGIQEAGGDQ
jgi:hypothetical protein